MHMYEDGAKFIIKYDKYIWYENYYFVGIFVINSSIKDELIMSQFFLLKIPTKF